MENANHPEHSQAELGEVINNLQRGFDSASYLDILIQGEGESGANNVGAQALIQEIKGSFSRVMTTLNSSIQATNSNGFLNPLDLPAPYPTSTPHSHSNTNAQSNRRTRNNRQRDELGTGTSQEMLLFLENPDDCYAWRINEQREVQNSAYSRIYYDCAYKDELNCCATKTVRRLEEHEHEHEHPPTYEVVYIGQHTCMHYN